MIKREIELLAPGGDTDSIKAAIIAGANAIYCGLDKFNARNRAANISFEDLNGILRLAHKNDCKVFLTLNIIIVESEIPALFSLLNKLVNTNIDGVIVQDFGMYYLLCNYFPSLKIHASTQLTTHNEGQIKFLSQLATTRVNLSRELNLTEIKALAAVGHENNILSEVFVHGSNCISFSGICYMSSVSGGNSGNRGRCSQPCRDEYITTAEGNNFPLNIKDNSAFSDLRELYDAGVDSVKIEGRIKKYHYVYTVVNTWRKHLQNFYENNTISDDNSDLRKVFNRDFSNSFLQGEIDKSVFIDNPRDNSAVHLSEQLAKLSSEFSSEHRSKTEDQTLAQTQASPDTHLTQAKKELYDVKTDIISDVKSKIAQLSINKAPLTISFSGTAGSLLSVSITTPETSFQVFSSSQLSKPNPSYAATAPASDKAKNNSKPQTLNEKFLLARFKALNDTEYFIQHIDLSQLQSNLFIPFKELATIKKKILFELNGSRETVAPIDISLLKKQSKEKLSLTPETPSLSVLISSQDDLYLCDETTADIYFQLPNSFSDKCSEFIALFNRLSSENKNVIPWFPSVLIGENYHAAVKFLHQVQPKRIVTNNTGIAYAAFQAGISWIAGPYLNLVNSFSLLCLKENFNCYGAFISNEINQNQIKRIKKPKGFKLFYSIYHPIVLMTCRLCLFHQVTGCKKNIVDNTCIQKCKKTSSITNLKEVSLFLDKSMGNYNSVYNDSNFLNTEIVSDLP